MASTEWRGQATQISLCSLMVNILSCGLAWTQPERIVSFTEMMSSSMSASPQHWPGDTGVNTLDTENKTLPPPERYLLPGVMFSPGLVTINTLAAQREGVGGENVISQPL